jgi:hypothetical protein
MMRFLPRLRALDHVLVMYDGQQQRPYRQQTKAYEYPVDSGLTSHRETLAPEAVW